MPSHRQTALDRARRAWEKAQERPLVAFALAAFARFRLVGGIERAMVIAAQAFIAVVPLLVLTVALVPGGEGDEFGERVVERFDLDGAVADAVRQLFEPVGDVAGNTTLLSVALLLVSGYTFARRIQGLYLTSWDLPGNGMRQAWRPLGWMVALAGYLVLLPVLRGVEPGHRPLIVGASFLFWLWTPYALLAGRVAWRALVPTAALTSLGMTGVSVYSTLYMSHAITVSTERFGPIGAAFAVVSWLIAVALVIVVAAVLGATVAQRAEASDPVGGEDAAA